jgi:hypothetical protein
MYILVTREVFLNLHVSENRYVDFIVPVAHGEK